MTLDGRVRKTCCLQRGIRSKEALCQVRCAALCELRNRTCPYTMILVSPCRRNVCELSSFCATNKMSASTSRGVKLLVSKLLRCLPQPRHNLCIRSHEDRNMQHSRRLPSPRWLWLYINGLSSARRTSPSLQVAQ